MNRILVLVCCVYAVNALKTRIIGGDNIDIVDAPYQVSVYDAVYFRHYCGGSIISPNYILTAAHCANFVPARYRIRLGSSQRLEGGQFINVIEVIPHKEYRIDGKVPVNDVALMKVMPPIDVDGITTRIIELAKKGEKFTGEQAMLSGWGRNAKGVPTAQLQGLTVKILSRETCDKDYVDLYQGIRDGQICAEHRDKNKDLCNGDSGGPLVVDGKQVGIVSWSGPDCALIDRPGVYTEVAAYRDWIDENMKA